jgi:hypothetical protein
MYNLTIHFGPNAVAWSFLYKDKDLAHKAYAYVSTTISGIGPSQTKHIPVEIGDDYGQTATFSAGEISGVLIEAMDLGEEARIIRGLSQARGQARANKRASNDPELQAAMRGGGPSVLTPFANGGFRQ